MLQYDKNKITVNRNTKNYSILQTGEAACPVNSEVIDLNSWRNVSPSNNLFYYPLHVVFDPYRGNTEQDIFYLYITVPWINCVNNIRFFTNISETVLPTNMYDISLKRSFNSTSACVLHKNLCFYIHCCRCFLTAFSHNLFKYSCYLTHKLYKMVYNKSKTSLIRHIQKKYHS